MTEIVMYFFMGPKSPEIQALFCFDSLGQINPKTVFLLFYK